MTPPDFAQNDYKPYRIDLCSDSHLTLRPPVPFPSEKGPEPIAGFKRFVLPIGSWRTNLPVIDKSPKAFG